MDAAALFRQLASRPKLRQLPFCSLHRLCCELAEHNDRRDERRARVRNSYAARSSRSISCDRSPRPPLVERPFVEALESSKFAASMMRQIWLVYRRRRCLLPARRRLCVYLCLAATCNPPALFVFSSRPSASQILAPGFCVFCILLMYFALECSFLKSFAQSMNFVRHSSLTKIDK